MNDEKAPSVAEVSSRLAGSLQELGVGLGAVATELTRLQSSIKEVEARLTAWVESTSEQRWSYAPQLAEPDAQQSLESVAQIDSQPAVQESLDAPLVEDQGTSEPLDFEDVLAAETSSPAWVEMPVDGREAPDTRAEYEETETSLDLPDAAQHDAVEDGSSWENEATKPLGQEPGFPGRQHIQVVNEAPWPSVHSLPSEADSEDQTLADGDQASHQEPAETDSTPVLSNELAGAPVPHSEDEEREAVRQAVEEMRRELSEGTVANPSFEPDAKAAAGAIGSQSSEGSSPATQSSSFEPPNEALSPELLGEQAAADREAVRRAVEEMRQEISGAPLIDSTVDGTDWAEGGEWREEPNSPSEAVELPPVDNGEHREDGSHQAMSTTDEDEEARREQVRKAVEEARQEMTSAAQEADSESPSGGEPRSILMASMMGAESRLADLSSLSSPVLVVEDREGRAELSQIFETLARVDRASQAALLSYSPQRIAVGLSATATLPDEHALAEAASDVFGVECEVSHHGSEIVIKVGQRRAA